jgi:hypothetical protein
MTKLEKDIILSINTKQSVNSIIFRKNMFYTELKGVIQNFAVIKDDYLFIRIDFNCKGISKKLLKNINSFNYKICLTDESISKLNFGIKETELEQMLVNIFYYYDLYFVKMNLDFKSFVNNLVNYFDLHDHYEELILNDRFWKSLHNFKIVDDGYWHMSGIVKDWDDSERDLFNKDEWQYNYKETKRNNIIDDLLNDN